ncbi:hypothetical protein E8L99_16140 [Phreatobacter aquaticus]|uniref:Uncharacterized protein n=1 Tax=Phreatobacter aquaticus TaxID=2570229 RepID=A0A4D7QNJ4_9HYPH|nr:hypothetical protein [Phreatobacter aquaticus]QCK87179.1 hypothetical protein E8L99_16140 [Phreatobacter aquaticus]
MAVKPESGAHQPEALALAAEAARHGGKKPDDVGLVATPKTAPVQTSSAAKDRAATKVLQEGVTGKDKGAEAAIDALPDRTKPLGEGRGKR